MAGEPKGKLAASTAEAAGVHKTNHTTISTTKQKQQNQYLHDQTTTASPSLKHMLQTYMLISIATHSAPHSELTTKLEKNHLYQKVYDSSGGATRPNLNKHTQIQTSLPTMPQHALYPLDLPISFSPPRMIPDSSKKPAKTRRLTLK